MNPIFILGFVVASFIVFFLAGFLAFLILDSEDNRSFIVLIVSFTAWYYFARWVFL